MNIKLEVPQNDLPNAAFCKKILNCFQEPKLLYNDRLGRVGTHSPHSLGRLDYPDWITNECSRGTYLYLSAVDPTSQWTLTRNHSWQHRFQRTKCLVSGPWSQDYFSRTLVEIIINAVWLNGLSRLWSKATYPFVTAMPRRLEFKPL